MAEEVTKRVISSFNAYSLSDLTHSSKPRDKCLRACGMLSTNWKIIRLSKKIDSSTCPILFKLSRCNDAKKFTDLSKNISPPIPYKSIKVAPDFTPCRRRTRRCEAIGWHDSVTVNNLLETVCCTVGWLKHAKNKHYTTPPTEDHSIDLDEPADQKPLD